MLWSEVQMVSIERDTMRQEGLARGASTLAIGVTQWLGKVNLDGFWSLRSSRLGGLFCWSWFLHEVLGCFQRKLLGHPLRQMCAPSAKTSRSWTAYGSPSYLGVMSSSATSLGFTPVYFASFVLSRYLTPDSKCNYECPAGYWERGTEEIGGTCELLGRWTVTEWWSMPWCRILISQWLLPFQGYVPTTAWNAAVQKCQGLSCHAMRSLVMSNCPAFVETRILLLHFQVRSLPEWIFLGHLKFNMQERMPEPCEFQSLSSQLRAAIPYCFNKVQMDVGARSQIQRWKLDASWRSRAWG